MRSWVEVLDRGADGARSGSLSGGRGEAIEHCRCGRDHEPLVKISIIGRAVVEGEIVRTV